MTYSQINLPSAISEIFELVSQFYVNLNETNNEDYMNSFLSLVDLQALNLAIVTRVKDSDYQFRSRVSIYSFLTFTPM